VSRLPASPRTWFSARAVTAAIVFAYLVFARTRHITETFVLLGDQILYWTMALGPFRELPLAGPSSVGGTTLGPAFVWTVWAIRHLVGPFTDNLPHAGGIGIAILQSAADACLLIALWRRTASAAFALAVTLLVATSPLDLALSATIWNPPVSVALIKLTIALVMLEGESRSIWWGLAATAASILAVQAHSSAVFVAAPVIASFPLRDMWARQWMAALRRARAALEVILLLEIPYLVNLIVTRPERVAPSMALEGVAASLRGSAAMQFGNSFQAVSASTAAILLSPGGLRWFGGLLIVCLAMTALRLGRDLTMQCSVVAPILLSIVGFATWQRSFDTYWFLTLAPSVALTLGLALTSWRPAATLVSVAMLVSVIAAQPARLTASMASHRLPEYGALLRGTREIRQRTAEVRSIQTDFPLPPSADREYLYRILGGRIRPEAKFVALIKSSGDVVFTPVTD
jgi:hypothetical protein